MLSKYDFSDHSKCTKKKKMRNIHKYAKNCSNMHRDPPMKIRPMPTYSYYEHCILICCIKCFGCYLNNKIKNIIKKYLTGDLITHTN